MYVQLYMHRKTTITLPFVVISTIVSSSQASVLPSFILPDSMSAWLQLVGRSVLISMNPRGVSKIIIIQVLWMLWWTWYYLSGNVGTWLLFMQSIACLWNDGPDTKKVLDSTFQTFPIKVLMQQKTYQVYLLYRGIDTYI